MSLYESLLKAYPELSDQNNPRFWSETIVLQDDSDGKGAYIAQWHYEKPIPEGLKLGK